MVGDRIRQARLASGLSQDEVVGRLAERGYRLTKAGLSKYEKKKSEPKPAFFIALARVLGVAPRFFLEKSSVSWIAFRKQTKLRASRIEQIKAFVQSIAEGQVWLQETLFPNANYALPKLKMPKTLEAVEELSASLRSQWNLGVDAIDGVVAVLESKGIIVVDIPGEDEGKFDGLSGMFNYAIPIVVLRQGCSVDRKRFNATHELGHLIIGECEEAEAFAHRFAASFLVPAEVARSELGVRRRHLDFRELEELKLRYGLSMQAWLRRAKDLNIILGSHYKSLCIEFSKRGLRKHESVEYSGREEPTRLRQLTVHALSEGIVSADRAEQLCPGLSIARRNDKTERTPTAKDLLRMPRAQRQAFLRASAATAVSDYESNRDLTSFEAYGDKDPNAE